MMIIYHLRLFHLVAELPDCIRFVALEEGRLSSPLLVILNI